MLCSDFAAAAGFTVQSPEDYPHDASHYTQGLIIHNGEVFETTGLRGKSHLYRYKLGGAPERLLSLEEHLFGEGLTRLDDKLYWITWKSGLAFEIDTTHYRVLRTLEYEGEGWGLTDDGDLLIMSDGSDQLTFRNPEDFSIVKRLSVTFNGRPAGSLNELEWVNGYILANVWHADIMLVINPNSGDVVNVVPLKRLREPEGVAAEHVLNGIAYDQQTQRLYVTGKNWPKLVRIGMPDKTMNAE